MNGILSQNIENHIKYVYSQIRHIEIIIGNISITKLFLQ